MRIILHVMRGNVSAWANAQSIPVTDRECGNAIKHGMLHSTKFTYVNKKNQPSIVNGHPLVPATLDTIISATETTADTWLVSLREFAIAIRAGNPHGFTHITFE